MPNQFFPQSNVKVWWLGKCGHEWEAVIASRTGNRKSGCPYCANQKLLKGFNDLETRSPELAKEWIVEKNEGLTPDMILAGDTENFGGDAKKVMNGKTLS